MSSSAWPSGSSERFLIDRGPQVGPISDNGEGIILQAKSCLVVPITSLRVGLTLHDEALIGVPLHKTRGALFFHQFLLPHKIIKPWCTLEKNTTRTGELERGLRIQRGSL